MSLELFDSALPCELRRLLVVARCRIIVEAVIGSRIDVSLVDLAIFLQGRLLDRPANVNVVVVFGQL